MRESNSRRHFTFTRKYKTFCVSDINYSHPCLADSKISQASSCNACTSVCGNEGATTRQHSLMVQLEACPRAAGGARDIPQQGGEASLLTWGGMVCDMAIVAEKHPEKIKPL